MVAAAGCVALVVGATTSGAAATRTVSIADAAVDEGGTAVFDVTLSSASTRTVIVGYSTAAGSATAADFGARSGWLTFAPGTTTRTVSVPTIADSANEGDETFTVRLRRPVHVSLARATAVGTIHNGGAPPVIAAAGDVACTPGSAVSASACQMAATANLLAAPDIGTVLALGDLQYEDGALARFQASYDASWGRVKSKTRPVPGNHEYGTAGASGYYDYFGAIAGPRGTGYYSFDVGAWHLVALNSNCSAVGGCASGSAEERWLRADLAARPARCTLAYWHHPRYSSGLHGDDATYEAFWQALVDAGADLVLVGHDHDYERFAPQRGIREFVVGTGGRSLYPRGTSRASSELFANASFGVLRLTLRPGGYDWRFVPATGSVTDAGSSDCH